MKRTPSAFFLYSLTRLVHIYPPRRKTSRPQRMQPKSQLNPNMHQQRSRIPPLTNADSSGDACRIQPKLSVRFVPQFSTSSMFRFHSGVLVRPPCQGRRQGLGRIQNPKIGEVPGKIGRRAQWINCRIGLPRVRNAGHEDVTKVLGSLAAW